MNMRSTVVIALAIALLTMGATLVEDTHTVTLHVDTSLIENSNVNEVCNFGQEEGILNIDFTIEVRLGDTVVWKGVSSNAPEFDQVLITSINHEGGARVFGRNTLTDDPDHPGVVKGVVTEGREGDQEKYKVSFKVFNNGEQRGGTFHIDPKIIVKN